VPPPYKAFAGAGGTVGAAAPAPAAAVVSAATGGAGGAIVVDESKPTASLQVKLANGRTERFKLNLTHTVRDLQAKVAR